MTGTKLRRVMVACLLAPAGLVAVTALEILIALRREYLPVAPALEVRGEFGAEEGQPLVFVVLGDSTAAGVGAGSADKSYPAVLASRLGTDGYRVSLDGFGVSGARLAQLATQVDSALAANPDVVLIAIGANDVTHATRSSKVRDQLRDAVDRLQGAGAEVVLAGVPDMRARAFLEPLRSISGWRGQQITHTIRTVAREKGALFVPLADRTARHFGEKPEAHFSSDDFHPSAGGYARWAEAMYPEVKQAAEKVVSSRQVGP